jgi:uncharacterized Zn-binding protein involved in type VI secretion
MPINPAVPGSVAAHWHGVPVTATPTTVPGHVLFQGLPPLHIGDFWSVHYVPEWESAHGTAVVTGTPGVICDGRPLACTCFSNVTCGQIAKSIVNTTIVKP